MALIVNPPNAANPGTGVPAQTMVSFTDTDPDTTYRRWDFGDGNIMKYGDGLNPSPGASVSHMYSSTGNFTLMLLRSTESIYQTIYVQPPVSGGATSPAFVITGITINPPTISLTDWAAISVTVKNTGNAAGAATLRITDEQGAWIADVTTPPIIAGGTQSTVPALARVQGVKSGQIKICANFMMGV